MKRIHYGWFVCAGCALLLFCTSGLSVNAFTVYQPYILVQNTFTNTQPSTIITVRSLFSFVAMFFTGRYYKTFSLRTGIAISGILTVLGFVMFGIASDYVVYCSAAAFIGIVSAFVARAIAGTTEDGTGNAGFMSIAVLLVSVIVMVILEAICKKFNLEKLRPFTMPISMFVGMGSAMLFESVLPADIVNFVWR